MAKKRLFQVLDDMNVEDIDNKTELVSVSGNFVAANKVKAGGTITMGVPETELYRLLDDTRIPVLLLVDKQEYQKRMEK